LFLFEHFGKRNIYDGEFKMSNLDEIQQLYIDKYSDKAKVYLELGLYMFHKYRDEKHFCFNILSESVKKESLELLISILGIASELMIRTHIINISFDDIFQCKLDNSQCALKNYNRKGIKNLNCPDQLLSFECMTISFSECLKLIRSNSRLRYPLKRVWAHIDNIKNSRDDTVHSLIPHSRNTDIDLLVHSIIKLAELINIGYRLTDEDNLFCNEFKIYKEESSHMRIEASQQYAGSR
jgi:hypothetical protein